MNYKVLICSYLLLFTATNGFASEYVTVKYSGNSKKAKAFFDHIASNMETYYLSAKKEHLQTHQKTVSTKAKQVTPIPAQVVETDESKDKKIRDLRREIEELKSCQDYTIFSAISANRLGIVKILLKYGVKINDPTDDGRSPLHLAVQLGHKEIVEFLLDEGANKEATDAYSRTPLHFAVQLQKKEIMELLIERSANIFALDYQKEGRRDRTCHKKH